MIIVDGDSVALGTRNAIRAHHTWAHLLGCVRDCRVANLATLQGTVTKSLAKLPAILAAKPSWYIGQFGQWSIFRHNRTQPCAEPLDQFSESLAELLAALERAAIKVCLITPPPQFHEGFATDLDPLLQIIRAQRVRVLDVHRYMQEEAETRTREEVATWFDTPESGLMHFSVLGHLKVAHYFCLPENMDIGA